MDNFHLDRYTGSYERFEEMVALKRRQEDAAYERQQAEIKKEQDFIARNKARVATRGMANSRQKRLDKMEVLTKRQESRSRISTLNPIAHRHDLSSKQNVWCWVMIPPSRILLMLRWNVERKSQYAERTVSVNPLS